MIPKPFIAQWQNHAPWKQFAQVEQDISAKLKEIFANIEEKENNTDFTGDMEALLRPEIAYNQEAAFAWLKSEVINRI